MTINGSRGSPIRGCYLTKRNYKKNNHLAPLLCAREISRTFRGVEIDKRVANRHEAYALLVDDQLLMPKRLCLNTENKVKEARISTLQKIVQLGLDGQLKLSIQL